MIFIPRSQPKAAVDVPCRSCRQIVRADSQRCPFCGASFPAQGQIPTSGFEWKTETEFFGYPLVHIAVGRDDEGRLRVAKGVIAIGQYAIGAFTVAQFGVALIFGIGQFILGPIVLGQVAVGLLFGAGQIATGYAAVGQLAFGYYAVGQIGLGKYFWGGGQHDLQVLEFFRRLLEKIGWHIGR
jgi:hypothetical protein